jgi:4-alpha-glucanotransferase
VSERERDFARRYLWCDGSQIAWDLIRQAYASVADLAIVPMQDALSLGNEARMNFPGRPEGNWQWRCRAEQLDGGLAARLRTMAVLYSRIPEENKQ